MFKMALSYSTMLLLTVSCAGINSVEKERMKSFAVSPAKDLGIQKDTLKEQVEAALSTGGRAPEFLASDLFIKGNDAAVRGDFQTAVALFRFVNLLAPEDNYIKRKLAVELIRMGELKEAEQLLSQVYLKNKDKDESTGLILAGVYTALDKNPKASEIYKFLIKKFNSEEACLYLAKAFNTEKKYTEAHNLLGQCEAKNKEEPSFAYYRGKIEYDRGNLTLAKSYFEKALKIDSSYIQAVLSLGAIYEDKENFNQAIKIYKDFINEENNTQNTAVLNKLVNLLLTQEKNEEVLPYIQTLTSLDTDDLNMKVKLGLLYSDLNRYDEALKVFNEILVTVPDSDKILYYLGALNQQLGKSEIALEKYGKIANSSPLFNEASIQIAQIMSLKAHEEFVSGKSDTFLKLQALINERIKDKEELALELKMIEAGFFDDTFRYKEAISTITPYITAQTFTDSHRYYFASLLEKTGEYQEARNVIQKILDKDPNNPHALNFIGYSMLEKQENMDKAFEFISKAVKIKPEDGYIRDSLAWYFFTVGKYSEALKEAKKAFELVKTDVTISKHLAKIYESLKNYEKAREIYAEALKNAKAQAERDDVLKLIDGLEQKRLPASGN